MAARKNIEYYRSAGYPIPALTWFFNQIWVYLAMALAGLIALGQLCYSTVTAADEIKNPPKAPSSFQQVNLKTSKAFQWAKAFVAKAPPQQSQWNTTGTPRLEQPLTFKECDSLGLPSNNLLGSFTGGNESITTKAQIYTPGNALSAYKNYQEKIGSCGETSKEKISSGNDSVEITKYHGGFFFTLGDSIIFVQGEKREDTDALKGYYVSQAIYTLTNSECHQLHPSTEDSNRNLFTSGKNYTGLIAHENITTQVNLTEIPNAVYPNLKYTSSEDQPEAPLPASFKKLPKAMQQPIIPDDPEDKKPQMDKAISYQIDDPSGPGCGWEWSGVSAPALDNAALKATQNKLTEEAQNFVDGNATKYVNDKLNYSRSLIDVMAQVALWNKYVDDVNQVHGQWQWLKTQRDALETPWYNYVEQHDAWINFDNRQANAVKAYNTQVTTCNKQNQDLQDWKDQWGAAWEAQQQSQNQPTPTESAPTTTEETQPPATEETTQPTAQPTETSAPTATETTAPVPTESSTSPSAGETSQSPMASESRVTLSSPAIPPMPQGCTTVPEIPAIAKESKGAEPQRPNVPENVTIPNSWPKPIQRPTVALNK